MYAFFEGGIRIGMTFVNKHYGNCDESQLLCIDVNNLYGWALKQKLPYSDLEWFDNVEMFTIDFIKNYDFENADIGYTFEVDLHVPIEYHDYFDQLPPAPINQCPPGSKVEKLLLTLEDKKNYVIHGRLLQCFVKIGVEVIQVHRVVKYRQDYIFKKYIEKIQ